MSIKKNGRMIVAVMLCITALILLWWKGAFLPLWIDWPEQKISYEDAQVQVSYRTILLLDEKKTIVYRTPWDCNVQKALICDIDRDGRDELVTLVWKRGNYGKSRPMWVKHNDIRMEQHIFIYRYDENRKDRLDPVWMSSSIGKDVTDLVVGPKGELIISRHDGSSKMYIWEQFGLKEY